MSQHKKHVQGRRNVSSIVRQLWLEFREHILAPCPVGNADRQGACQPTLPTGPTATAC